MPYIKCASCKKFYYSDIGGCTNANCAAADRALIAKLGSTPVHPLTKKPIDVSPKKPVDPPAEVKAKASSPKLKGPPKSTTPSNKVAPTNEEKSVKLVAVPKPTIVPAPVAVTKSEAEEKAVPQIQIDQAEAGWHIIYRGDTRDPKKLATFGGFTAWVPLNLQEARNVVKRSMGQNFQIKLPKAAARLEGYFNKQEKLNLLTLGRQIKLEKAGDTFHISTDPTEGCGGYASGYIYAMKFKTLFLIDKNGKASPAALKEVTGINSYLVMDTTSLDTATTIAVAIPGQAGPEVAFLTTIPMAHIYKYKEPKQAQWRSTVDDSPIN
ncbi:MAG TPA: hypothetical protein VMG10_18725 [Gemmataceae bacterium]|nr:hypothetical protein [Gemmataceae bacterium]